MNQGKILYDPPPRVMEIKTKLNKWDLIKLKSFCTAEETISKVKRQPSEWGKIIANETTDRGLIFKMQIKSTMRYHLTAIKMDIICTYGQSVYDNGGKNIQWRKDSLFLK